MREVGREAMAEWSQKSKKEKLDYLHEQLANLKSRIKRGDDSATMAIMKVHERLDAIEKKIKPVSKKGKA
jgi:hypothetical protein